MFDKLIDMKTISKATGIKIKEVRRILKKTGAIFKFGHKYYTTKEKLETVYPDIIKLIKTKED